MKLIQFWACLIVVLTPAAAAAQVDDSFKQLSPALRLGYRLYMEKRLTNPASNFAGTCHACHRPEHAPEGRRAYADLLPLSLVPTDSFGGKRTTSRNSPSIADVAKLDRFGHDGRFNSLEEVIMDEITADHFGWLPEEREYAKDEVWAMILNDAGVDSIAEGSYLEQFKDVYGVELKQMNREEVLGWVVRCLAEYVSSFSSRRETAYDNFMKINDLPTQPSDGQSAQQYGESLLGQIIELEDHSALKIHAGFGVDALTGFKTFLRTTGDTKVGNCVSCHVPPLFTDGKLYNTGVAQAEYDAANGEGAFVELEIPSDADRPVVSFLPKVEQGKQINADLGYWNYVDIGGVEDPEAVLSAAIGAFKTPHLRNLSHSNPYMHNGAYRTLEDAVAQKLTASTLAKAGSLRSGDSALAAMNITADDIKPLTAFLKTLDDIAPEEFAAQVQTATSLSK